MLKSSMQKTTLENPFSNAAIFHIKKTSSTMILAQELAEANLPTGTAIYADFQSHGRGRVTGRKWIGTNDAEDSLFFTTLFKKGEIPFATTLFPLFAGFCLSECLEKHYAVKSKVKWPNDLLIEGKKISGILCETKNSYISCGMGINIAQKEFPGEIAEKATSLKIVLGKTVERKEILLYLLKAFKKNLKNPLWENLLEEKLYKKGESIFFQEGLPCTDSDTIAITKGIITGIGSQGELIVKETETELEKRFFSGEIRLF